jgi:1-acyl-sn-glycerol-3-phosphate acyltransferase
MGVRVPLRAPMSRILRWCTVGAASYAGWAIANLLLLVALPFLAAAAALDRGSGYASVRRFGAAFLRCFFLGWLSLVRLHRFAELPARAAVERGRCVFAANHRSWMDPLLALALFPGVRVPVNAAYTRVPLMAPIMRWMGCVTLDRRSPERLAAGLAACRSALAAGEPLFVFPEGRRTAGPGLAAFGDAFFRLALEDGAPIVPVVLHSDVPFLAPGGGSLLTRRRAVWTIRVLDAVPRDARDGAADLGRLARKALARELERLDGGARENEEP